MYILVSFLIILLTFLFYIGLKQRIINQKFNHIPGISKEYPIIGNLCELRKLDTNDFKKLLQVLCPAPICKLTGFGHVMFTISHPSVVQKILLSPVFHQRNSTIRFLEMENALFTSKYENWKPIRKPLNLAFNKKCILSLCPIMNSHIDVFCEKLGKFIGKGEFDIYNAVAHFEIDEIFETFLNTKYKCTQMLVDTLQSSTDNIGKRVFNPIYHPEFIYKVSSVRKEIQNGHTIGTSILKPIITEIIQNMDNNNTQNLNSNQPKYTLASGYLVQIHPRVNHNKN
uniref:CSON009734 protein n=1 Tax=Culicoides sonorensis TaxID=179676 RepID=A0A336K0W3_CULSO